MIEYLRQEYESIFEDGSGAMTVSRGKIHKYIGMTLDYTVRGHVKITMFNYVDEILTAFDKAQSQVRHPIAFSKSMRAAKSSSKTRMWSYTTS
jgi:hypothetical protein